MIVALVGFMGSGKTSVGKKLARMLDVDFYDTDQLVEQSEKATISEIWQDKGERYFRTAEEKVLIGLMDKGPCVIALGGGLFENPRVRGELKARAISIWLHRQGVIKGLEHRPLVSILSENELAELCKKRSVNYAHANFKIVVDGKRPDEVATEILQFLKEK